MTNANMTNADPDVAYANADGNAANSNSHCCISFIGRAAE
jgi:hypothetical protein